VDGRLAFSQKVLSTQPHARYTSDPESNPAFDSHKVSMANACDLRNAYDSSIMVTYDVTVEEALEGPFYDPIYQAELQKDREIARAATNALKRADLFTVHGDNLARLIQDGESLSEFEVSSTRTIAILGGSGEGKHAFHQAKLHGSNFLSGKSSLINSLLHYPEIAKCVSTHHVT
jgi:hypothetical protein